MKQELIWLIQRIPYGMVVSYGELASQMDRHYGIHTSGWLVGRMLSSMSPAEWKFTQDLDCFVPYPKSTCFTARNDICPRWRVINKQWMISALKLWQKWLDQIRLLETEWIQVVDGQVDMKVYEYNFIWL